MNFQPEFLDQIRLRVSLSDSIGRRVPLTRKGREFVGLCPFHKEKTPSFTVNDEKGFFHCFGCGAHGDVIGFDMRMDGLGFPEAVERLANLAGLALPKRTPEDRERAKQRTSLYGVMEAACVWFEQRLADMGGSRARDYLTGRGLDAETIAEFRLGWAPDSRGALKQALAGQGISEAMIAEAGLVGTPDDGSKPYDRFRGRIIFPITDRNGRVVAFGGRALGDSMPKYLNSPETPLFHKGRMLYGLALARKSAHDIGKIIVAEGYMDVIALHRSGFKHSVAPLGTALTEDQIRELWRLAREPIVCFDGDNPGQKAAHRILERVLPLLEPGRSIRFAVLPSTHDPDSLIQEHGAPAFQEIVDQAIPPNKMIMSIIAGSTSLKSPDDRAKFEDKINKIADKILNKQVQKHYRSDLKSKMWDLIRSLNDRSITGSTSKKKFSAQIIDFKFRAKISKYSDDAAELQNLRFPKAELLLVAAELNHPNLARKYYDDLVKIDIVDKKVAKIHNEILYHADNVSECTNNSIREHFNSCGLGEGYIDWIEEKAESIWVKCLKQTNDKIIAKEYFEHQVKLVTDMQYMRVESDHIVNLYADGEWEVAKKIEKKVQKFAADRGIEDVRGIMNLNRKTTKASPEVDDAVAEQRQA